MKIILAILVSLSSTAFAQTCKTNEGVEVRVQGTRVTSISAPVRVVSKWGQSEVLGMDLEVEGADCNEGSSVRYDAREQLLVATCHIDSGPTMWYTAPVTCK